MLGVCACTSSVLTIAGAHVSDAAIPLMSMSILVVPGDKSPIYD